MENLAASDLGMSMKTRVKRMDPRKDAAATATAAAQMAEASGDSLNSTHLAFFLLLS